MKKTIIIAWFCLVALFGGAMGYKTGYYMYKTSSSKDEK